MYLRSNIRIESLSEKHFFNGLSEYILQVDEYLKTVICTFHNILKNSLLQSINEDVLLQQADLQGSQANEVTH